MNQYKYDFAIYGGGPTGIFLAYFLGLNNKKIILNYYNFKTTSIEVVFLYLYPNGKANTNIRHPSYYRSY